ncbi:carbohydrate esterase family 12 protein [Lophiostoma macrostomum CBS 122681]|uniref:Carbohydrate esterase family 12 protein n=1 Tax=Lophiostoma macrostomum CBS 122681 TaxID=1314788 RepID=A0A6A6TMT9_9PLEO|nr:carbohydrate esterase family 12 protein [Lophiostoma macrostomum CBS 122681]
MISLLVSNALVAAGVLAAPTIFLAGDSTMTAKGNNDGTAGWGLFLNNYTTLAIENDAVAGRSARSFTREGRFTTMAANVKSGDFVVIEFGHNDGGTLSSTSDNGRTDCSPLTYLSGVVETVQTYYTYLVNAAKLFQAKGANVIISSATPNNVWETGTFTYSSSRFVTYASDAAKAVGATFADHGLYTAQLYKNAGATTVSSYYPHDHTHTSPEGAKVVARAFTLAVKATDSSLKDYM